MENTNSIISENIRIFRKKTGLTQEDLAQKLGVTFQAVSKWENGQSAPDIMLLPELSEVFGCTIDEIFSRKVEKEIKYDLCTQFPWQDDDVLRGVVCVGRKILQVQNEITDKIVFEIKGDTKSV
ncbi:MAG: helix-turn-helix transcriptional regulator [Ruminococcaceae bacterium]|nr:helix-turn-helix transcriptional regulator [Oscillospiraceae bacterium]